MHIQIVKHGIVVERCGLQMQVLEFKPQCQHFVDVAVNAINMVVILMLAWQFG